MANRLETIAENKKKAALAKQDADVERFAKRVALEVVGNIKTDKNDGLKESVSELALSVAQAIVLSNKSFDERLDDKFTGLIKAVKLNRPDNTSLVKLNKEIGRSLAKFETALDALELSPKITLAGITREELKAEVDKILSRMPSSSRREVTLAYENATADKYINVRLTDGIAHYKAFGGSVSGGREGGATETKQDDIIAAIEGIGGSTNYATEIRTVGALTYIGNAVIGSATSDDVWQIKRLDTTSGLTKKWADGNENFDNIFDDYASLSYS